MKKLVIALPLLISASAAHALSDNAKYIAADNTLESNLCVVAATKGYQAAKQQAKKVYDNYPFYFTKCNGVSVKEFAQATPVKLTKSTYVPADGTNESKICAQAVKVGLEETIKQHDHSVKGIVCNGQKIEQFVRKHSGI